MKEVNEQMKNENTRRRLAMAVKITCAILFFIYLAYLLFLTFFSRYYGRGFFTYRRINIIPLKTILLYASSSFNTNIIVTNLLGNILAFVPMGFLVPLVWRKLSGFIKILLVSFAASLAIEIAQYITGAGAADIDDLILNTAGGILGYIFYYILKILPVWQYGKRRS